MCAESGVAAARSEASQFAGSVSTAPISLSKREAIM
jgi:hypothetical protein